MTEHDDMRRNARQIAVLKFCCGCDKSILPGQRGDDTGVKDVDGFFWHRRCWKTKQKPLPPRGPACIEDLYGADQ